jgi:hypothetical protein
MALVSVNGQDAIETRLTTPRIGAWHLDVLVDDPTALAGVARVVVDSNEQAQGLAAGLVLVGTVVRSGVFADTGHIRIVAGAGGLGLSARPRHYTGTSVRIVLGDLLAGAGEKLAATADQSVLSTGLDAWTTGAVPVGTAIALLLATAGPGIAWRMLPDGTLWVGRETWPDAGVDSDLYQIFEDSAETNSMRIGVDGPLALVGTLFQGRQVSATEATVGQLGDGVEMRVWFEDGAPEATDRLRRSLTRLTQRAAARQDRVDYGRLYPATIVSQTGGTVDVQPDLVAGRALLPDMASVPLWLGLPGASVDGTAGGRVLVGWMGGDPARPFAAPLDALNVAKTVILSVAGAGGSLLLGGLAGAQPAIVGGPHQTAEASLIAQLIIAFGALQAAATGPLSGLLAGFSTATLSLQQYQAEAQAANNFLSTKVNLVP